jgi:transposase
MPMSERLNLISAGARLGRWSAILSSIDCGGDEVSCEVNDDGISDVFAPRDRGKFRHQAADGARAHQRVQTKRVHGAGPKARRGSTPKIRPSVREHICRTAKSDPARLGCPLTCSSLTKLRDYIAEAKYLGVSHETIRQVLRRAGISFQNTKTWKHSGDRDSLRRRSASSRSTTRRRATGGWSASTSSGR